MSQELNYGISALADSINKYIGLGVEMQLKGKAEEAKSARELENHKSLENYKTQLDLSKFSAQETYKLALEGKISPDAAAAQYPDAAKAVEEFTATNGRNPTVTEFDKFDGPWKKKQENNLRQQELHDQRLNSFIQKHTQSLATDQIPELVTTFNELAETFKSGKDVKGVGVMDSHIPNIFLGEEGQRNRTNLQQMANTLLKKRSGAAVSDQEYARFLKELAGGKLPDEKTIRTHIGKMGKDLRSLVQLRESGIPKEALNEYYNRPGSIKSGDIDTFTGKVEAPAKKKSLTDIFGN